MCEASCGSCRPLAGPPCCLAPRPAASSAHVDVDHLDGVVAVAEPVPRWDLGLHVPGRIGRPGAEGGPAHGGGAPVEGPVLPGVGAGGLLELRLEPVPLAGE